MSTHLEAATSVAQLVPQIRATLALTEATRAGDFALLGKHYRPSLMRDALVQLILLECGEGRIRNLAFYHRALPIRVSAPSLAQEVNLLRRLGIITTERLATDHRCQMIAPTPWSCPNGISSHS